MLGQYRCAIGKGDERCELEYGYGDIRSHHNLAALRACEAVVSNISLV